MKFVLRKTKGDFRQEKLPILIFFTGLVILYVLHFFSTMNIELCHFRRLFGFECPSCGVTRAFIAATQGDFLAAIRFNPLMLVVTIITIFYLILIFLFKRAISFVGSAKEQNLLFISFLVLLLLNWIYILLSR